MATTPNFNWATPDNTGLVKNGALDIRTLGNAIDASLVDLKGGTTAQVLTKASNTDMDFTWSAASGGGSTNVAGKNVVLNSSFNVWQRGTSIATGAGYAYGADRWETYRGALVAGSTVSRQLTNDTTNLPFIQYCARVQRDSGNTGTQGINFGQNIETINSISFAGRTVTLSFYARAGANYSSASSALNATLYSGTGTDQNYGKSWTSGATVASGTATLTTTWQRFTYTGTVATNATQLAIYFQNTPVGTAGAADFYEVTGVQVEIAGSASAYSPNTSTYQGELAACQRYYYRPTAGTSFAPFATGLSFNTTNANVAVFLPVPLRTSTPTALDFSSLALSQLDASYAVTALTLNQSTNQVINLSVTVSSGLTAYRSYLLVANATTAAFIGLSAEL